MVQRLVRSLQQRLSNQPYGRNNRLVPGESGAAVGSTAQGFAAPPAAAAAPRPIATATSASASPGQSKFLDFLPFYLL